ncbi:hypothetical protein [Actinomadura hibisca]|uniref:hypothetical protein n=1 Tax=Actinomadura hibisca TaxID=68565 RepID=UPI0008304306|nr:hypothetical protein [Actinomadura hibisca]
MSDPFLFGEDGLDAGLRRCLLQAGLSQEAVDQRLAEREQRIAGWASLADLVGDTLLDAGFPQHDPTTASGGFHLNHILYDEGVLVDWALPGERVPTADNDPFHDAVEQIMNSALCAILTATGYTAHLIPDDQDDAGCVMVVAGPAEP